VEGCADLGRRNFAHRALWAAAIFLLAKGLMGRWFFPVPLELAGVPKILASSLCSTSIFS
jgi:hypothetical protein